MAKTKAERNKEWYQKNRVRLIAKAKAYRLAHPEKNAEWQQTYRERNKALLRERHRAWHADNPGKATEFTRKWQKANTGKCAAAVMRRIAAKRSATPAWANTFFLEEAYDLANRRTALTGVEWHVDHIVPLNSRIVCGLHTHHNVRVIPGHINRAKSNRHWPDMP